jgi:hypothetical protein
MADPFQSFVDQYKENCNTYVRRAPVRLLGLALAFPVALGLAAAGALVSRLTGEPLAAGIVIVAGAVMYLIGWIVVARMLDHPSPQSQPMYPQAQYPQAPYPPPPYSQPPAPGMHVGVDSPFAAAPNYPPQAFAPIPASAPPNWPDPAMPPAAPARSGSGGCVVAALGTFAILMLSCCGGGIFLSRFAMHAGPANQPFQAGAPFPGDPFADMQRQQQRQLDDMLQRQQEQWREIERDRQRMGQGPGWE